MNRAIGAMSRGVPRNVRLRRDIITWRTERLALLHGSVKGVPTPIVGAVHVTEHALPGIDLVLAGTGQIQPIDGGAACISAVLIWPIHRWNVDTDLPGPFHEAN